MYDECPCRFSCNAATLNNAAKLGTGDFVDIYRTALYELGETYVAKKKQRGIVISNPFGKLIGSSYKRVHSVAFSFAGLVHYLPRSPLSGFAGTIC